jgi:hypothetical protein
MQSTYRIQVDELNADFVEALKKAYSHREIEIVVNEVHDETAYLLRSPANRDHLQQALLDVERRLKLVEVPFEKLES